MTAKLFSPMLLLLGLSSCQAPAQGEASLEEVKPQWAKLPDGSVFAITHMNDGVDEIGTRCWSLKSGNYKCLMVLKQNRSPEIIHVFTVEEQQLPDYVWPIMDDGYRCGYSVLTDEAIWSKSSILISNFASRTGKRWSASFVADYMRKNAVEGSPYFECLDILDAVMSGSTRTIGTTSIKREMLG